MIRRPEKLRLVRSARAVRYICRLGRAVVEEDVLYDRLSSGEPYAVTCTHRSRPFDHSVHARTGELTGRADFNIIVPTERREDVGVLE